MDYIERSPVRLSSHIQSEAIHNMSAHQLPQYYQPHRVPFPILNYSGHAIYVLQTNRYKISQNI